MLPVLSPSSLLAAFADNLLPALSPFSLMAAFADNLLPVLSPFSPTVAFADNVLPVMSPFSLTAAFADNVLQVMLLVTKQKLYNLNITLSLQLKLMKKSRIPFQCQLLSLPPTIAVFRYNNKQKILRLVSARV